MATKAKTQKKPFSIQEKIWQMNFITEFSKNGFY